MSRPKHRGEVRYHIRMTAEDRAAFEAAAAREDLALSDWCILHLSKAAGARSARVVERAVVISEQLEVTYPTKRRRSAS